MSGVRDARPDVRPVRGIPGLLPEGESLLWQGAPDLRAMAFRVFHVRKVALYFAALSAWRFGIVWHDGADLVGAARAALFIVGLGALASAILFAIATLVCRTTVYSITSRRIVMRIGVALPITFNIPFAVIGSGSLRLSDRGVGTIPVTLTGNNRLAFPVLWPHARPWRVSHAEPALRLVPDAARVAHLLSQAVCAAAPGTVQASAPVSGRPAEGEAAWPPLAPAAA